MNVLVLAPHADDEVLGCGGAIRRHVLQGDKVVVVVLTNASIGAAELFSPAAVASIREEARAAHAVLGVTTTVFDELPAPQLDQFATYKLADCILGHVNAFRPDTVYVPHRGDLHVDHQATYRAALVALRPQPGQGVHRVYAYETLSETEWSGPSADTAFLPMRYVNIESTLPEKISAMKRFASQLRPFPHPRSIEAIQALAAFRGSQSGLRAAEAFSVVRETIV